MKKNYKVGIAGMVHGHVWGEMKRWMELDGIEIVAAADVNGPSRRAAMNEYGVSRTYETWSEMIEKEPLDIVQAASENNVGADIVVACASRGIHVVSEKPMAATYDQAVRMHKAATDGKITLLINWPMAWHPTIQEWERRILAGDIGVPFTIKYRAAHNGPREVGCDPTFYEWLHDAEKNGAGTLMDFCCYSADLNARFLGLPTYVTGMRGVFLKEYPVPDDNAIIIMKYPHAFGIAEASWTQPVGNAEGANPIAYGSGGSISVCGDTVVLQQPKKEATVIMPAEPPPHLRSAPAYLIHCLETGETPIGFCSAQVSLDAQAILEAGLRSADTGRTIGLPF